MVKLRVMNALRVMVLLRKSYDMIADPLNCVTAHHNDAKQLITHNLPIRAIIVEKEKTSLSTCLSFSGGTTQI